MEQRLFDDFNRPGCRRLALVIICIALLVVGFSLYLIF